MIQINDIEITARDEEIIYGGPWAPDGVVRRDVLDGGCKKLAELFNDPPDGCFVSSIEWNDLEVTVHIVPHTPAGLRSLADALDNL